MIKYKDKIYLIYDINKIGRRAILHMIYYGLPLLHMITTELGRYVGVGLFDL